MKKTLPFLVLMSFIFLFTVQISTYVFSQEFVITIGDSLTEKGFGSFLDPVDSSLTVVGSTNSAGFGSADALVSHYKLDNTFPFLNFQWAQVIGDAQDDLAYCIRQDIVGKYIVCGSYTKPDPNSLDSDLLLTRIDNKGNVIFARSFDVDGAHQDDVASRVIVGFNQEYIIVGTTKARDAFGDIVIAAIDSVGDAKWGHIIGKPETFENGYSIIKDSQQSYVVLGTTGYLKTRNIVLIKLNAYGNIIATREIGAVEATGAPLAADFGYDLVEAPNQDAYVITGGTRSFGLSSKIDLLLLSIKRSLSVINWNTILTSSILYDSTEIDEGHSIIRNEKDELIVAGLTESMSINPPNQDVLLATFDSFGAYLNARRLHPDLEMHKNDFANDVILNRVPGYHNGYIATGTTESDGLGDKDILIASFQETDSCCYDKIPFVPVSLLFHLTPFDSYTSAKFIPDIVHTKTIKPDTAILCYPGIVSLAPLEHKAIQPKDFVVYQNYPNPFNPGTEIRYSIPMDAKVEVAVFNLLGEKVATLVSKHQQQGVHKVAWDGRDDSGQRVSSGVYLFTVKAGDQFEMKKMVMMK